METYQGLSKPLNGRKNAQHLTHHTGIGLLVFDSTGRLLFLNQESQRLMRQLQPPAMKECGRSMIAEEIHAALRDLLVHLKYSSHPKDCEKIQTERLCFASKERILIRGFCIPEEPLARKGRFLITMEKLIQDFECPGADAHQRYHLTKRQQMVIIYLMLGFTNKEIAMRLNLSEHTVKEHLKRIMKKPIPGHAPASSLA